MTLTQFSKIVSYGRVSDPNQATGTGLDRQFSDQADWIAAAKLTGIPLVKIADEGRSAFHGHHMSHGELGKFETEALAGEHQGTLFLAEHQDRLSREGHDATHDLIRNLTRNGVTIRLIKTGDHYPAGEAITLIQVITGAVRAETAREESLKKSFRTASNWQKRRERCKAEGTCLTALGPAWLKCKADKKPITIEDRAALILRWFQLCDETGRGADNICRVMEDEGIPTWERFAGRRAKVWNRRFVADMLTNREVIGEFQPMVTDPTTKMRVPDPDGPWIGHFPVIVPPDLFARVNNVVQKEARINFAGGRNNGKINNLFASLMVCKECGSKMHYHKGRSAGTVIKTRNGGTYTYQRDNGSLVCPVAHKNRTKCANRRYLAYLTFEDAVLDSALHLALDDSAFSNKGEVARLATLIAGTENEADRADQKVKRLWNAYGDGNYDMLAIAKEATAVAKALRDNIDALVQQREEAHGRADSQAHLRRVADVRANLHHDDLTIRGNARRKVANHLGTLIQRIEYDGERASIFAAKGHMLMIVTNKGKVSGFDLMRDERWHEPELNDYRRRRRVALTEGLLLKDGLAKAQVSG